MRESALRDLAENESDLHDELVALLQAHDRKQLAGNATEHYETPSRVHDPALGAIGPYKILEVIGEGGMGTVLLAEQSEPVRRRVALKVIKLGMDTKDVIARFEAERQALAMMDHPNIARVLDAGTTGKGRPYFAMEYVPGDPITTYCDKQKLSVAKRLRLFKLVCLGIQHAHQKGIIHRDLKPSNVLVQVQDGKPVPKIIDFGLAKATNQRLTERTLFTQRGAILGTPEYMSPEQAEMTGLDVDTRSDIYSMGVLLYQLIAGQLPFAPEKLRTAGYSEIQRTIREVDPPRPSTRLSTKSESSTSVALQRGTDFGGLVRQLRGDLDWITMKALEKDPNRRYQTALGLMNDIEHHLQNEPVNASPPSSWYRIERFLRRNKGKVAAAAVVFVSLIVGIIATTFFYFSAEEQREAAEENAKLYKKAHTDLMLLANVVKLQEAKDAVPNLAPAWPENVDAMLKWREDQARPLKTKLTEVRDTLRDLEQAALAYTKEDRARDRRTSKHYVGYTEAVARREELSDELEDLSDGGEDAKEAVLDLQQQIRVLDGQIPEFEQELQVRRTFRFANPSDQFLHDWLSQLVEGLTGFVDGEHGEMAIIEDRLRWAEQVERETLTGQTVARKWGRAAREIARSSIYRGMTLVPQMGLVPLGENPVTRLWEFGHPRSGTLPGRDKKSGRLVITPETGLVFVLIPKGLFRMGAQAENPEDFTHKDDEYHKEDPVELGAFFLAKYEMTQGQWYRLNRGLKPSEYSAEYRAVKVEMTHPVERVSWTMCRDLLEEHGLVIPTEAQWEYACRTNKDSSWPWSTGTVRKSLQGYANVADSSANVESWKREPDLKDGHTIHAPVGTFLPNAFGLCDMHGNVWEWCRDQKCDYLDSTVDKDGLRVSAGAKQERVIRGGCFARDADYARSAFRNYKLPDQKANDLGIRPARRVASN